MNPQSLSPSLFLFFIVIPFVAGGVIGAMSDRQSAARGAMIGGIAGGLIGFFAMILLAQIR